MRICTSPERIRHIGPAAVVVDDVVLGADDGLSDVEDATDPRPVLSRQPNPLREQWTTGWRIASPRRHGRPRAQPELIEHGTGAPAPGRDFRGPTPGSASFRERDRSTNRDVLQPSSALLDMASDNDGTACSWPSNQPDRAHVP